EARHRPGPGQIENDPACEAEAGHRPHHGDKTSRSERPVRPEHGVEAVRLRLRLRGLLGHVFHPINGGGAREDLMPSHVVQPPARPRAKRQRARKAKASPDRVAEIFRRFAAANPNPRGELAYINPFTLLVAVVLSAQATDAGVNKATRDLFKVADSPQKM